MAIKRHNCSVDGCEQVRFGNKLCLSHYKAKYPEKFKIKASTKPIGRKPLKPASKPLKKVSKKQQEQLKEYYALREQFLKENPICQCCNIAPAIEIHHRFGRGIHLLEYLMGICRVCHMKIHENPEWALENGYLISKTKKLK